MTGQRAEAVSSHLHLAIQCDLVKHPLWASLHQTKGDRGNAEVVGADA